MQKWNKCIDCFVLWRGKISRSEFIGTDQACLVTGPRVNKNMKSAEVLLSNSEA